MSILTHFASKLASRRSPPMHEMAAARGSLMSLMPSVAPYNPDDLIGRRGYAIYDQMQNDPQVRACLQIKKASVLSRGWQVRPASGDPADVRAADFVRFALEDMRGSVLDVLSNALDALAKGFSVMEINYRIIDHEPWRGMIGLASIKAKDPSTFTFDTDEFLNIRGLRRTGCSPSPLAGEGRGEGPSLLSPRGRGAGGEGAPSPLSPRGRGAGGEGAPSPLSPRGRGAGGEGISLPPEKFVIYSHDPRYESPYGSSDLRAAYKHYWSKDILTRFMNAYLEKYGTPTASGYYKRGTPKQAQQELLAVLDSIRQRSAIVLPDDIEVRLLEAQRGGEAGYLQALEWHDKQIAKAILCQTLIVDEGVRVGSFALAKIHLDVLKMCLTRLKRDLEETVMREQVIRRLVEFNFAPTLGPDLRSGPRCPVFTLGPLEDRDVEQLAGVISKLVSGEVVKPDEGWIREYLGLPSAEG